MPTAHVLRVRRTVLRHRRSLAAALLGIGVLATLRAVSAPPPPTVQVLTAAHDLPAGTLLDTDDLTARPFAPGSVPAGALAATEAAGRMTAAPMRAGEAVTDVRLVQPSLLDGYPGTIAVPVRLSDPGVAALLRVGDRIDLVAAEEDSAEVVAADVPVIAMPQVGAGGSTPPGALIVIAVSPETAVQVTRSGVSSFMSALIAN